MAAITIRFSRAAPPNLIEMWRQRSPIDYSMWIARLTHCPFSHVDLKINYRGQWGLLGASNNLHAPVIFGNPLGVAIRPLDYQRFALRRDAVIETTPLIRDTFEKFCLDQVGKPFDDDLTACAYLKPNFSRDWRGEDKWYCAELLGRATEVSNLIGYPYPATRHWVTAADLSLYLAPKVDFAAFWLNEGDDHVDT